MSSFKCSRCHSIKDENEFGLNRKDERNKTCISCNKQRIEYNKSKKDFEFKKSKDWVEHPEYKGYFANKLGQVVNKKTKKLIGVLQLNGYILLSLYITETKHVLAHRFIWECFNGVIEDETLVINHINEIKNDNRLENLELVTKSQNTKKSTKKIKGKRNPKKCKGRQLDDDDWIEYKSLMDAERKTSICHMSIQRCCDGITNSCSSKTDGTKWEFKYN